MATTSTQTQKDLVRLLVIEHGMQKASELSGVDYDLVRQWESRRKRRAIRQAQASGVTVSQNPVSTVLANVESELADNERETKLSLSRYARTASKDAESATMREAPYVKAVTDVASKVHKWEQKEQNSNVVVNVALLGIDPSEVSVSSEG